MKFSEYVKGVLDTAHVTINVGVYDKEFDCISKTVREEVDDARYINDCSGAVVLIKSKNGVPLYIVLEDNSLWSVGEKGLHKRTYEGWLG